MKVLWISHFVPYPPKGGMLIRSFNLLKELAKEFDVELIALARKDTLRGMYTSADEGLVDAYGELSRICSKVTFVPTQIGISKYWTYSVAAKSLITRNPYTLNWFESRDLHEAVQSSVKTSNYDVVHVDTVSLAAYPDYSKDSVFVLDHHNIESDMMFRRAERDTNILRKLYYAIEARSLRRYELKSYPAFDLHITCSHLDSDRLGEIVPDANIREIPNGVDVEYWQPGANQSGTKSLIFIGGQGWYPNRDAVEFFASEVWPFLKEKCDGISFDLIGRDPSLMVRELAEHDSQFNVHGFVDDVRPMMLDAAIYICPIRDGGGTKLKILDALASGKAIVAHPCAVEGISVTHGENVWIAESAQDFVDAVQLLLSEPRLRARLGASARALAESRYSYEIIGAEFRKSLTQLRDSRVTV